MQTVDVEQMTIEASAEWGYPHVRRILALAEQIAGDLPYHPNWFRVAAYLHDWGAYPRYRLENVEHALRSRQVVEVEILPCLGLSAEANEVILEAIERHDLRDPRPVSSPEALLLREADFLDFLGPLGIAREFSWGPKNLKQVIQRIHGRMDGIRGRFTLPAAQKIAETRFREMEQLLEQIERDSLGFL